MVFFFIHILLYFITHYYFLGRLIIQLRDISIDSYNQNKKEYTGNIFLRSYHDEGIIIPYIASVSNNKNNIKLVFEQSGFQHFTSPKKIESLIEIINKIFKEEIKAAIHDAIKPLSHNEESFIAKQFNSNKIGSYQKSRDTFNSDTENSKQIESFELFKKLDFSLEKKPHPDVEGVELLSDGSIKISPKFLSSTEMAEKLAVKNVNSSLSINKKLSHK